MTFKKWDKSINKYLEKKSEVNRNLLTKKNLYIFPNSNGFKLAFFIFFSFASSIFYQNNVGLLVSIILFIIYFISIIISYQNLSLIKIKPLNCLVPRNKNVYLSFFIKSLNNRDRLNLDLFLNKEKIQNFDLIQGKKIDTKQFFLKRGVQDMPQINLESVFPFGVIKAFGVVKLKEKLFVYPEPIKPPNNLISNLEKQNLKNDNDYEFDSIEEGKLGENLSRISWKHYSILKKLFTKKFITMNNNNKILIDIEKLNNSNFELSLSYAAYLIEYFYNSKKKFALKYKNFISNYSNSTTHKNNLLKFIANV